MPRKSIFLFRRLGRGWAERRKGLGKCLKVPQTRAGSTKPTLDSKTMEPNYGATDDEANTPLMEQSPLLTDKPRRGRAIIGAAVIGTTLMAATATTTQRYADLRASLRTPRGTPTLRRALARTRAWPQRPWRR